VRALAGGFAVLRFARTFPPSFALRRISHAALDVVVDDEVKLLFREPVMLRTFPREVFILETKPSSLLTGGSRSCANAWKAAILVAVATSCDPPAWRAAILAALQPPAGHHRISQSPVAGSCVPRDRHLPVGRGVPPSRQVGSLVPRDRVSRRRITLTISA